MAARAEPLQQQLLAGVYSCWGVDPATRLPVLAAAPPAGDGAATEQQAGDTAAAAAMLGEIWKALGVFGLLPQALGQLAAHFMEHCVAPILASGAPLRGWAGAAFSCVGDACAAFGRPLSFRGLCCIHRQQLHLFGLL